MAGCSYNLKKDFGLKYDVKDIGLRIKKLRQAKNMTVNFLAHKSCVDHGILTRTERGTRDPALSSLLRIIHGLGLQPRGFFEGMG
jgi:transcriptional regulator with XRE-family HTH domain